MNEEITNIIKEKGVLLEKRLFDLLNEFSDSASAKDFLEALQRTAGQRIITSSTIAKNVSYLSEAVKRYPAETKELVETTFVKMGLTLEITHTAKIEKVREERNDFAIFYPETNRTKKIDLSDFVTHFRSRYQQLQKIIMQRQDLGTLLSINKLGNGRDKVSIIGMLVDKKVSKNKNFILTFEDLTGSVKVLVKEGSDCYSKAAELQLDEVVAIKGTGSREIIFAYDIIFPDSFKEKVKFNEDYWVAFISDIHAGSKKHRGEEFEKFLEWISSEDPVAKKVKYLFVVGDNVDGVGVFPGQEGLLELKSLHQQYALLASYLKKIPERVTIFMCPGQHDSVRVAEPQPIIDNFYGKELYEIKNLVLVTNPALVKLREDGKEFKVLMYHGASIHSFINEIEELRVMKAHRTPAKAVKHMLKRRHLAPSHGVSASIVYVPGFSKDNLVIEEVPDILCTGEVHRLDIENYNGTVIITGSCWQSQTEFEEKVGNVPDPCKVPMFNVSTREMKILDFTKEEKNADK